MNPPPFTLAVTRAGVPPRASKVKAPAGWNVTATPEGTRSVYGPVPAGESTGIVPPFFPVQAVSWVSAIAPAVGVTVTGQPVA